MGQTAIVKGRATSVRTEEGITRVRYHDTDVVAFDKDTVTLNSGGWLTVTTKTRMNQASIQFGLGYHVWQSHFEWFVNLPEGRNVPFNDYMTFDR